MGKIVVLRFNGDLEQSGFQINSIVQEEINLHNSYACRTLTEVNAALPADPELAALIKEHWQQKYRSVGAPSARKIEGSKLTIRGSLNQRKNDCLASAKKLTESLISWLESKEFQKIDRQLREAITPNEIIRFLIRTDDNKLYKLPWEEWDIVKRHSKTEVVFGSKERNIHLKPSDSILRNKVKILAILGHSQGINIEKDRQQLESLKDIADVVFLVEPQRKDISEKLWQQPWDIIFFAGHSETQGETGRIYLNSNGEYLELQDLWFGLRRAVEQGLKAAIFNSCDGLGLANSLDDLQIPLMIIMRELVPDEVAQQFFMNFIEAFRQGKPFHLAEREAREKLQEIEDKYPCATWLPIIYQNLETPLLKWIPSPPLPPKPNPIAATFVSIVSIFLVIFIRQLGGLSGLELKFYDYLMQARPTTEQKDERLLLITADAKDVNSQEIEERNNHSISDAQLEKLLQKLNKFNPAVIGFSNYRPLAIDAEKYPFLAEQFGKNGNLIVSCSVGQVQRNLSGYSLPPGIRNLSSEKRADRIGFNNGMIDNDNRVRRELLMMPPFDENCPSERSFSLTVAYRYLKTIEPLLTINTPEPKKRLIGNLLLPSLEPKGATGYPADSQQYAGLQILLNYRALKNPKDIAERLTVSEFIKIDQELIRQKVENRIVLIGTVDEGFAELLNTPYTKGAKPDTAGLYVQAHSISQLISAYLDNRPLIHWWPRSVEYFWIGFWSFLGGTIAWQFRRRLTIGSAVGIAIAILGGSGYLFLIQGYWIPVVPCAIALILTLSGTLLISPVFVALKNYNNHKPDIRIAQP
ncbi:MAG: CHASE2 domain-containing protein [Cyanobacteria bacterium J06592_8]